MRPPQVFCYITSWSQKRPGSGKYTPEDINPSLCTHIIYAFATLKEHKLTEASSKDLDMYDRVVALRDNNPDLKVSLNCIFCLLLQFIAISLIFNMKTSLQLLHYKFRECYRCYKFMLPLFSL